MSEWKTYRVHERPYREGDNGKILLSLPANSIYAGMTKRVREEPRRDGGRWITEDIVFLFLEEVKEAKP